MKYKIGSYEIDNEAELGRGMHSIVYKGINDNNPVAIKKIDKTIMSDKNLQMLDNEIYVMKMIRDNPHKNVVKCYNIIDDLDDPYTLLLVSIVMIIYMNLIFNTNIVQSFKTYFIRYARASASAITCELGSKSKNYY